MRQDTIAGANAGRSRSHNRQVVLGHIRSAGKVGRAEIARASGLSTQAVSNIIADLEGDGLLVPQGRLSSGRGLPAVQYALNPEGGFALGIEIRPDVLFAALLDLDGRTVFSQRLAMASADPGAVRSQVIAMRDKALEQAGAPPHRLLGAGVVMPGPFGTTGLSTEGSELPDWRGLDAKSWFAEALGLPVYLENDANAAAMSEQISGVARGLKSYAYLYFGTGLGLGIVSQGRLLRGGFGNAGEIGHILVQGKSGPVVLEQAVSRLSAQTHLRKAGLVARSVDDLSAHFASRNPTLMAWIDAAATPLSHAVTTVENILDPEAVILGGAMPDAILDHLIEAVSLSSRSVANRDGRTIPRLLRGASGRMTATLGAAALVLSQTFTPQIAVQR